MNYTDQEIAASSKAAKDLAELRAIIGERYPAVADRLAEIATTFEKEAAEHSITSYPMWCEKPDLTMAGYRGPLYFIRAYGKDVELPESFLDWHCERAFRGASHWESVSGVCQPKIFTTDDSMRNDDCEAFVTRVPIPKHVIDGIYQLQTAVFHQENKCREETQRLYELQQKTKDFLFESFKKVTA